MRPFRFGVVCSAHDAASLHTTAREAEARGYSTLALTDHLDLSGAHVARLSWLPALASAAAVTSTLRLTTMVANQDLRHPAVLAREVATLSLLSDGRFELGLGAGWNPVEYDWAGIPLDEPVVRIRRLAEYTDVLRGLLSDDPAPFSFAGEFFTVSDMPPLAAPGHVPIVLGGAQRTMLSLAARAADTVNLLTLRDAGPADAVLAEKVAWVHAAAPGRDPELAASVVLVATEADDPVEAVTAALPRSPFARHVAEQRSAESVAAAPHVLAGGVGRIADELRRRRRAHGVTYWLIPQEAMAEFQPVLDELSGT